MLSLLITYTCTIHLLSQETFKQGGYIKRYMDTWDLCELQECRAQIHGQMPSADVTERFDKWGGSPRYVLQKLDLEDQAALQQAIDSCSVKLVQDSLGNSSAHDEVSNRVLHLRVKADFINTYIAWASPWVAEQIAYKLWRTERQQLILFLNAGTGLSDLGGVRGNLWEGLCHARLAAGGTYRCRDLDYPEGDPVDKSFLQSTNALVFDQWSSLQQCAHGTYCRPRVKNKAAVDSALLPDALFQITVSGHHSINCAGLLDSYNGLHSSTTVVTLYFVVPPDRFPTFKKQSIAQGVGVADLRHNVRQCVLEMPFQLSFNNVM
jgi:hypothetical protein